MARSPRRSRRGSDASERGATEVSPSGRASTRALTDGETGAGGAGGDDDDDDGDGGGDDRRATREETAMSTVARERRAIAPADASMGAMIRGWMSPSLVFI